VNKIEYRKIIWGVAIIAVVLVAVLVVPKIAQLFVRSYNANAQASAVTLSNGTPTSGPSGTVVNLYGTGFTSSNNTVNFGNQHLSGISSPDGTSLFFNVPTTLSDGTTPLPSGAYPISITNANGTSNAYAFNVTNDCSGNSCNSTSTYQGPLYLCRGTADCIMGFKVPIGGVADSQVVTLDGRYTATTTSYSFDTLPPGLHTVSVTVPDGWYSGFTLCINNVTCHDDIPIAGKSVSINFLTTNTPPYLNSNGLLNVPAGSYIDLYWHFSQDFSDFASAPGDLNNGATTTGTSTRPTRSQVASYTGGGASTVGPQASALQGISQATTNALGCTIGQILTPAIRGVISGDRALLATPKRLGGGGAGGGGSIDINDATAPYITSTLPQINGSVTQNANDARYIRAAQVGFPNQPSWDAVSYCLENAMIKYIQQSTLNWMYTAFNGNPAFVQNLSQFLLGVQNETAKNYFTYLQSQNSGAPFQGQVIQNLVKNYSSGGGGLAPYNAQAVNQQGLDGIFAVSQNDDYNIFGAELKLTDQLQTALNQSDRSETLKYLANQGQLNIDSCSGVRTVDAFGQPTNCLTQVTGAQSLAQFNANNQLATQRLANNAGGYDQMVTQLVNNLIQTALGQLFKVIQQ